jgi:hypothetical protein
MTAIVVPFIASGMEWVCYSINDKEIAVTIASVESQTTLEVLTRERNVSKSYSGCLVSQEDTENILNSIQRRRTSSWTVEWDFQETNEGDRKHGMTLFQEEEWGYFQNWMLLISCEVVWCCYEIDVDRFDHFLRRTITEKEIHWNSDEKNG